MAPSQSSTSPPLNRFRVDGRIALVTGASKGIGRACAERLAQAGAQVIAVARSSDDLETLAAQYPGAITTWTENVTHESFMKRLAGLNRLDILVNNVGTNTPQSFLEVDGEVLDRMLDLNVRSAFLVAQAGAKVMTTNSAGSIINMSSQMGHVGAKNRTVYCMTKHAIEGLTKAMAIDLATSGIRVNSVAPTFIETPMTQPMLSDPAFSAEVLRQIPMNRFGQVDEVADAVLFLASDAASMITGDSLKVDGGWTAQ